MKPTIALIGGGPAGLIAAEKLAASGIDASITIYERKPSPARKFLMAGRGGLNLTHSEPLPQFMQRYGVAEQSLKSAIDSFTPQDLRDWCDGLGEESFVGSSGRVFPKSFKASPLLRAWLARLDAAGVQFKFNCDWQGWDGEGRLIFEGMEPVKADATLLALGGASWAKLGSDGGWTELLAPKGIAIAPMQAANCGFTVAWSDYFRDKFAGQPLKPVITHFDGQSIQGEMMISRNGIEGGAIYALAAALREALPAKLEIDLRPGLSLEELTKRLSVPRARQSFPNFLRKIAGLSPVAASILYEGMSGEDLGAMPADKLAARIKAFPLTLTQTFPIDRAISSAGGIAFSELDDKLMLKKLPGVFAAGEMLDWEAPTGGYLLQASFATGVLAAHGIAEYLRK